MRTLRTRALQAVAVITVLAATAACGGGEENDSASNGDEMRQVTVGLIPIVDVAPIYLGDEQGFFEERNIELTMESGQGGAAIVPGVMSGQFQFGFSNVTSLMLARGENLPLKVVAPGNSSTGVEGEDFSAVVVADDSPIQSAADLEGKTVAVNTLNNIGTITVRESVRQAGGNPDSVKFVELGFPDMPAAVAQGNVDAAWVVEPFVAISEGQGHRVIAWNLVDTFPELMIAGYFTSEKLMADDPELVEDFVAALTESLEYAEANPDETKAILKTYTEIDDATLEAVTLPKFPTTINEESTQKLADLAEADGLVKEPVDVAALLP